MRYFHWWLALGWLCVVAVIVLSLLPKLPAAVPLRFGDKVGHLIAYLVMMGWFVQLYRRHGVLLLHAVFLIAMGVGLEFLQGSRGRHFEVEDMVANATGVVLGLSLFYTPLATLLWRVERRLLQRAAAD